MARELPEDVDLDTVAVVALGSNLPGSYASSEALLGAALSALAQAGAPVLAHSSWWRSTAWPDPTEPPYVNGVALIDWTASPAKLLRVLRGLERHFGRRRGQPNAPRTLDLDLIACGRARLSASSLILPHPRAFERRFVMGPLAEIAPAWRDPGSNRTALDLARSASVGLDAEPIPESLAALHNRPPNAI
jgi:2-amino-4-hydroxy-6-hydroxymethyldihydropteridine diphosphokinase